MKNRSMVWTGLLVAAMALPMALAAEEGPRREGSKEPQAGAWQRLEPSVWTRKTADGATETYAVGARGMQYAVRSMQRELDTLTALYDREPSTETLGQIEKVRATLAKAEAATRNPGIEDLGLEEKAAPAPPPCNFYSLHATAYSLTNGVAANADSRWCQNPGRSADIYSRAYAQVTAGGVKTEQTQTCTLSGQNVNCIVAASVPGSGYCTSEAYSSIFVFIPGHNLFWEVSATRCGCNPNVLCAISDHPADEM
jgi:hypothetical protein